MAEIARFGSQFGAVDEDSMRGRAHTPPMITKETAAFQQVAEARIEISPSGTAEFVSPRSAWERRLNARDAQA
jgi:hypothetical protein